jgi:hypothetical protein
MFFVAPLASIENHESFLRVLIDADWLEESLAFREPIAWAVSVHMFRCQTKRAMVAIRSFSKRRHVMAAVFAGEGFFSGDEHSNERNKRNERIPRMN